MHESHTETDNVLKKPYKLRNHMFKTESYDLLHNKNIDQTACSRQLCLGSIMATPQHSAQIRPVNTILLHAEDFLQQYFASVKRLQSESHLKRLEYIKTAVSSTGTYQLTETELIFGAKLAWRNASRCIGRIQWSKLQVFDCRYVTTTTGMFEALCNHIKYSTNKGNIRSAITVFPQRTDGKHDYRIWNHQLISYAGYKNDDGSVTGDAGNIEFTEICMKLGWSSAKTQFDILPLVLSANGHDPDYFDIPKDLVLEVPLIHPTFDWFAKLNLKWYAVPAVSNMVFDCGGLEFTAAPFNGWYMSTEIGSRDLCDVNRYNQLEVIASHMGLDIRTSSSLWKDKAMIEANLAVLYSFQMKNVTIIDHHSASDSFIKHYENEMRLRNGCPADWVWIIPPLSGSATSVFYQEMALYHLKPSYGLQESAWKTHIWRKGRGEGVTSNKPQRKFHFKQIARAVKFTSKLFGKALSKRIKATILYATETGRSQMYAEKLNELLCHAFHSQVQSMVDYDITKIEHEALLLVIASTFGNGDPPENGEVFAHNLYAMKMSESCNNHDGNISFGTSKSFIKINSQIGVGKSKKVDRIDSLRDSITDSLVADNFGALSNVRFAVFALGSSAYPNFCAFGQYVDNLLDELGGERLLPLSQGDEMCGQEQAFQKWASKVFKVSCETFCLDDNETLLNTAMSIGSEVISVSTVRFVKAQAHTVTKAIKKCHNKDVMSCNIVEKVNLSKNVSDNGKTILLKLKNFSGYLKYQPGDHLGVFACNKKCIVDGLLRRIISFFSPQISVELQIQKQVHTPNGLVRTWTSHEKYASSSLRTVLTRYVDITTPPAPNLLRYFASIATCHQDRSKLYHLANDSVAYEDWKHWNFPNLLEVLTEFPSVRPYAPVLLLHLTPMQPRFYSISSSPLEEENEVHLTVAVVQYKTRGENGSLHYGVCSNYLNDESSINPVYVFIRSAPNFHMPDDKTSPVILVGPGTGIAPFRGFWRQRKAEISLNNKINYGNIWLFFGCRQKELDLYRNEKNKMISEFVLDKEFLALSREPGQKKMYVQNYLHLNSKNIYKILVLDKGHFYVCGDCTMAENVYQTLKQIIQIHGKMSDDEVETYMLSLRDDNRFHEDIFGITLRTAEVHNRSRANARNKLVTFKSSI